MRTLVVMSTLALVAVQVPAAEKEAEARARFQTLELKLLSAVRANDAGTIERLLSPDFAWSMALEGRPNVVENRNEWINGNQYYNLESFDIGNLVAEEFGKYALVHFHLNVAGQIGKRTDVSGGYVAMDLWERKGNEWVLLRRFVSRPSAALSEQ